MPGQPSAQEQRIARIAGVLWILTFLTSIPAYLLYHPEINHVGFITGTGSENRVLVGAALELLLIIANIGTAVVWFSIVKRESENLALAFVTARVMESAFILVGILCLLALVTLRQDLAGGSTDHATLETVGRSLTAVKDWTFVLGPGFVVGIGNGMILGYLMYRSGLVPRQMAILGLIGGPLIFLSGLAVVLGISDQGGAFQGIATVPEFVWELSLGIYLVVKGFRPSHVFT